MKTITDLDLTIVDGMITNITELVECLKETKPNKEDAAYLMTLKNKLAALEIGNKHDLEVLIDSKIIEYSLFQKDLLTNNNVVAMLQHIKQDYASLKIIETVADKNNSNKYVDYLTYSNEEKQIEVVVCKDSNSLKSFIIDNLNNFNFTAKEFFQYYRSYIHADLKFYNQDEFKQDIAMRRRALLNDPEIERLEYAEVENYKKKYGIISNIEVTIDDNGERLYRLDDGLIKFHTESNVRIMDVLKPPTLEKQNVYGDLLNELEKADSDMTVKAESTSIKINEDSYSSLEDITASEFSKERLIELVSTKNVYEMELSYEEEHQLNVMIKYLIEQLRKHVAELTPTFEEMELLADILEHNRGEEASIIEIYQAIIKGIENKSKLTGLEMEFARKYITLKEQVIEKGLDKNNHKKLELLTDNKNNTSAGVTTVVVLLELMILALFIFMFLSLDI